MLFIAHFAQHAIRFIMLEHVVLMHIYDLFPAFAVLGKVGVRYTTLRYSSCCP